MCPATTAAGGSAAQEAVTLDHESQPRRQLLIGLAARFPENLQCDDRAARLRRLCEPDRHGVDAAHVDVAVPVAPLALVTIGLPAVHRVERRPLREVCQMCAPKIVRRGPEGLAPR